MSSDDRDGLEFALVPADPRAAPTTAGSPSEPPRPVQAAIGAMLQGAVAGFGDVVQALLCDLDTAAMGLRGLSWLWSSQGVLDQEAAYRAAVEQLRWWDSFLADLPCPELISERRQPELRRNRALRARARLQAREAALADHRRLLEAEVAQVAADPDRAAALMRVHADPAPGEWRVDLAAYEAAALAAVPELEEPPPIVAEDLDAAHSFAGFHAVDAMRRHPLLAPRAQWMDQAIADALSRHLDLQPRAAAAHARVLTGMFWIALRRALETGSNQLATSVRLLSDAGDRGVQERFTRELLLSWLAYLDGIPPGDRRRASRGRLLPGGRRRRSGSGEALAGPAPRQLPGGSSGPPRSWWSRVRRGLGMDREAGAARDPGGPVDPHAQGVRPDDADPEE